MSKKTFAIFGIFAAVCLVAVPLVALTADGSGSDGLVEIEPRDEQARDLFAVNCGSCHTLAAAGTDGVVGPNLDTLLAPTGASTAEAYEGLYSRTLNAISCGLAGRMPRDIVVGEDARTVSQFVAAYAGRIGQGPAVDTSNEDEAPTQPAPVC